MHIYYGNLIIRIKIQCLFYLAYFISQNPLKSEQLTNAISTFILVQFEKYIPHKMSFLKKIIWTNDEHFD